MLKLDKASIRPRRNPPAQGMICLLGEKFRVAKPGYHSVFRPGLFAETVAIVTGGGSGIGRCTAHELAFLGARVALVGRTIEKLQAVKAEVAMAGGEAEAFVCDIREEETVRQTIAAVLARVARGDPLVDNARRP